MLFTKIVATIGPSCDSEEKILEMYEAGMRVARLNFSHSDHDYFRKTTKMIRKINKDIAIMMDTKGPEIRTGKVVDNEIELVEDEQITLTNKTVMGTPQKLTVGYSKLSKLKKGNCLLLDDGLIELHVMRKKGNDIIANIVNGGKLRSRKTVTIQGHNPEIEFLSLKDKKDIALGVELGLDYVAASFVRSAEDVLKLQEYLASKKSKMKIISKIEHPMAIENIDEIIKESLGIMVARGDLGVELPMERIPNLQKDIISKCNLLGKPVIVATQMLESMTHNPRPTRAEIADVAQAILDGADAIMLSGETAMGKYPTQAVSMMAKIAKEYDHQVDTSILQRIHSEDQLLAHSISMFVTRAAYMASDFLDTKAIITPTETGFTARKVSRFKPKVPIYAMTRTETVFRQLQLSWGVFPFKVKGKNEINHRIHSIVKHACDRELMGKDDKIIITSGHLAKAGHTNALEIYKVGSILREFR